MCVYFKKEMVMDKILANRKPNVREEKERYE